MYNGAEWDGIAIIAKDCGPDSYRGHVCALIDVYLRGIPLYECLRDEVIESMEQCVIDACMGRL